MVDLKNITIPNGTKSVFAVALCKNENGETISIGGAKLRVNKWKKEYTAFYKYIMDEIKPDKDITFVVFTSSEKNTDKFSNILFKEKIDITKNSKEK